MANTATVLGQGGTTVTLVWQTASNASIAQQALSVISNGVTTPPGTMQEVSYTGGSTLPALSDTSVTGVVLAEGAGAAAHTPFQLSGQYRVAISNDTSSAPAAQGVLVGLNAVGDQVFIGGGGGGIVNFGINTEVFFTGASSVQSFQNQGFLGISSPSAQIWMDGNATVDGSSGATTTHIDDLIASGTPSTAASGSQLFLTNNGNGHNTVNIATSASTVPNSVAIDFIMLSGTGNQAATINAAGSAASGVASVGTVQPQVWVVGGAAQGAAALVEGGSSQLVVFGGGAPMTVDGGAGKGDIGVFVSGRFQAGTGGNAIMAGSLSDAQASTLVGGGNGDIFFGLSNNTTMVAGVGSETEASFAGNPSSATAPGATFMGNLGSGASTTTMLMESGAHSKFVTGNGKDIISAITGNVGGTAVGNTFIQGVYQPHGSPSLNDATINGFNPAVDTISTDIAGGGNYTTVSGSSAAADQIAVDTTTSPGNSTLHFGDGTTWTIVGATVTGANFHNT